MKRTTPFHLVDNSPWPILGSLGFFFIVSRSIFLFQKFFFLFYFSCFFIIILSFFWWRDVIRETSFLRFNSPRVHINLLLGIAWFISSEIFFFFAFFWSFFHSSLSSSVDLFIIWPPNSLEVLNPLRVPLLNTVVLLSSRVTVTWAHYSIFSSRFNYSVLGIVYTIFLGVFFTFLQYIEYKDSSFLISDSVYRSVFFIITGFHRFHVLIGSCFLFISFLRLFFGHFTTVSHIRLECSIWYWHFVDVVWIFLYIIVYWWGSN